MPTFKASSIALVAGVALVAGAIGYQFLSPEPVGSPAGVGAPSTAPGAMPGQPAAGSGAGAAQSPSAVTVVDALGGKLDAARLFELGFAGGLVIDRDTRAAIEAVLNSMPDEPTEQDLARLERTLREGLPKDDADKAIKLFTDYRAFTTAVQDEIQPMGIPNNMQEANVFFDRMDALKRRHFDDATASALFGQHDANARITMEAMFVEQDNSLTPEQKKERLDALRAKLPPDQQSLIPQPGGASQPAS